MSFSSFLLLGFVSPNAVYAAECTADEIAGIDISNLSTGKCTVPDVDASSDITETFCAQDGCFQDLRAFAEKTAEFPDCEVSGQNFKELTETALGVIVTSYEAQCPGNIVYDEDTTDGEDTPDETPASNDSEDMSDAHGWSAVHYMLATVLPMALLWV